jgi:flagellar biogenesis protein FliO
MLPVAAAVLATAGASAPSVESLRFEKTAEAAEFAVRLSAPLRGVPAVRSVGGYVAFVLPGVRGDAARKVLDAKDPLFRQAVLLSREGELLVALRTAREGLAARARAEVQGRELRLRIYRSEEALRATEAARDLEKALAGEAQATAPVAAPAAVSVPGARGPDGQRAPPQPPVAARERPPAPAGSGPLGDSTRAIAAVALAALAAVAAAWFLRRGRLRGVRGRSPISVLAAHPVGGGKRHLLLVEVQGEHFLVGSAEGGVSLLARLEAPPAAVEAPPPAPGGGLGRFVSRLREAWRGGAPVPRAAAPTAPAPPLAEAAERGPAFAVALGEAMAHESAPDPAVSAADLVRRKLAELNRV